MSAVRVLLACHNRCVCLPLYTNLTSTEAVITLGRCPLFSPVLGKFYGLTICDNKSLSHQVASLNNLPNELFPSENHLWHHSIGERVFTKRMCLLCIIYWRQNLRSKYILLTELLLSHSDSPYVSSCYHQHPQKDVHLSLESLAASIALLFVCHRKNLSATLETGGRLKLTSFYRKSENLQRYCVNSTIQTVCTLSGTRSD